MKQGNEAQGVPLEEVEARMRPGRFSETGFLGPDESLRQVLESDARVLAELGVRAQALAARLSELLQIGVGSKRAVTRTGHYKILIKHYKGLQICPFAPQPHENPCPAGWDVWLASMDWEITNTRTCVQLTGPGLIVHLIGAHNFFEGMQSPYRVAPRALAELLELGPFTPLGS